MNAPIGRNDFKSKDVNIDTSLFTNSNKKEFKTTVSFGYRNVENVKVYTSDSKWGRIKNLFGLAVAVKDGDKTVGYVNKQSVINHYNKELTLETKAEAIRKNPLSAQVFGYNNETRGMGSSIDSKAQAMDTNARLMCKDIKEMLKTMSSSTEVASSTYNSALSNLKTAESTLISCKAHLEEKGNAPIDPQSVEGKLYAEIKATLENLKGFLKSNDFKQG